MHKQLLLIFFAQFLGCNEIIDITRRKIGNQSVHYTITYADRSMVTIGCYHVGHLFSYPYINSPVNGQSTIRYLNSEQGLGAFDRFKAHHDRWQQKKNSNNNNE